MSRKGQEMVMLGDTCARRKESVLGHGFEFTAGLARFLLAGTYRKNGKGGKPAE